MPPSKVVVVHSNVDAMGGAENHCVRVLSLLQKRFDDITLVHTGGALDADRIFRWCGIRLDPDRVRFVSAAPKSAFLQKFLKPVMFSYAAALHKSRALSRDASLVVGTFGECPIDHPRLLQSIHVPLFFYDRESLGYLGFNDPRATRHAMRAAYIILSRLLSGWSRAAVVKPTTITNSHWTREQFERHYGPGSARTIHHGASVSLSPSDSAYLPFSARENNFVILGRVVPNKRVDLAISIVERLREQHSHDVGLRIIGRAAPEYEQEVRALMAGRPWIEWHSDLTRTTLEQLIARQKWGLHCYRFEHYGLAPAELQHLGCITFVPDFGGQTEIITDPRLRYTDMDDAVAKIDAILRAPRAAHDEILADMARNNAMHSVHHFEQEFLDLIDRMQPGNTP
jgi:glycosyltransferase involved in cell wall biosynthesis